MPAFETLDAVNSKVLDGGHSIAYFWSGKNKTAVLFTGGPGGPYGMDMIDFIGWMYEGGGWRLYQEFYTDVLKMNIIGFPTLPTTPQAFGWFKRPIKNLADLKGMKCRQTGITAEVFQKMGMSTVNLPPGEIIPAAQRGVIDCAEYVGGMDDLKLGFPGVWKYHYTPGHARVHLHRRDHLQPRRVEERSRRSSRKRFAPRRTNLSPAGGRSGRRARPRR